ncbi:1,4-dihydroxy-2-naphthoate polyprenyltransferase [Galbibacter sp. EGI 63066]|uniref:1,4-dihydroxy-2-naphthoate polyprenyltransferase n=1 Tax=Galbibacter sp. EGI 63066 TaxID=2993559 RepID=UPI002248A086|nr:1,4-dihydroxy-2-naphthoate polyprenyltransferase [Galbibacter sp. EGI 63066]MCX2680123.1 1,4-dihydroxy-2-naphthoate polyprenyltransferase [Galbibacter sp. EGI 63066]
MTKSKTLLSAARLRTLPLSVSGIIVGSAIAFSEGYYNLYVLIFALTTTVGLQILSNFANDYGDGVKGTDNMDRVGPVRAIQSGVITNKEMLSAIVVTVVLTIISAIVLIYFAFRGNNFTYSLFFFLLGIAAVVAAIKYTVGNSAYGYSGFGDVFVFIFFGLVSVAGSYFLYTQNMNPDVLLPAFSIGLLSVGVLNLNNMRDMESDKKAGKHTLVVKIGAGKAKQYHYIILILAMFFGFIYLLFNYRSLINLLFLISYIPIILHLRRVYVNKNAKTLDPELKKLALSTFFFAILFLLSYNIFL